MTFNEMDDFLTEITKEVRVKDESWAWDVVERMADELYEGDIIRMFLIWQESGWEGRVSPQFAYRVEETIEAYAAATKQY